VNAYDAFGCRRIHTTTGHFMTPRLQTGPTSFPSPDQSPPPNHDEFCVDTIRTLTIDAVQKADSGHPGTPTAMAPVAYTLWQDFLRYDPADPLWPNRDRFVLSAGHASLLL
jgi:transketolase